MESQNADVEPIVQLGKCSSKAKLSVVNDLGMAIHIPGVVDSANVSRAKGVMLADKNLDRNVVSQIDILFGGDCYNSFITGIGTMHNINL